MPLSAAVVFLGFGVLAQAQCPEDPNDLGECDTLVLEAWDPVFLPPGSWDVMVPIYVTHDDNFQPPPNETEHDSISAFVIPLCFTYTNAAANVVVDPAKNNLNLYPFPDLDNSIFQHLPDMATRTVENWMMVLSEDFSGRQWDTIVLNLTGNGGVTDVFWLTMFPTGYPDQRFGGGDHVLLATMTFEVEDTTTICVDSCFALVMHLSFTRSDATSYVPRHSMPYCFSIQVSARGDANGDGQINVSDALYMLNYLFRHGPPPVSFEAGDANCDNDHGALDVVFLLNYLFRFGPAPGCP